MNVLMQIVSQGNLRRRWEQTQLVLGWKRPRVTHLLGGGSAHIKGFGLIFGRRVATGDLTQSCSAVRVVVIVIPWEGGWCRRSRCGPWHRGVWLDAGVTWLGPRPLHWLSTAYESARKLRCKFILYLFFSAAARICNRRQVVLLKPVNKGAMLLTKEEILIPIAVGTDICQVNKYRRGIHETMLYTLMMINSYIWSDIWW